MAGWNEHEILYFFERCRNLVCNALDTVMSSDSPESLDHSIHSIETVYINIVNLEAEFSNLDCWNDMIAALEDLLTIIHQRVVDIEPHTGFQVPVLLNGNRGRPKYSITEEQLTLFVEVGFTCRTISQLLHVSESTIHRRLRLVYLHVYSI